jgi:decaprenylphospho-beta-D-erythro-pentofuranosid-2-ulose 2-reductase
MSQSIIILGATSGIARALGRLLAGRGDTLVLTGRNHEELERLAADLRVRGARAEVEVFDALDFDGHPAFFERCLEHTEGALDGVVVAFGYLGGQSETESDFVEARRTIDVNFTCVVSLLNLAAQHLQQRSAGWITVLSSVAGDRGRQSNYTYGAAKAGLSAYLSGLRNRLARHGVHVLTVKPGFVDTAMTRGIINPRSPLLATPDRVAEDIVRAIESRTDVLYTPWFWKSIMRVIRAIPEPLFKRLKL